MTVSVGIIGAGHLGTRHALNLLELDEARVVAVADTDVARAADLARRCDAQAHVDYRALLDDPSLDAVYLCVPAHEHGGPELAVLERSLALFVERPLDVDLSIADRIAAEVDARGVVTATGCRWRYLDTVERAAEVLADNPARMVIGGWAARTHETAWWEDQRRMGGQLIEQTNQLVDLCRLLVGEIAQAWAVGRPTTCPPEPDAADTSAVSLRFAGGAAGSFAATPAPSPNPRPGLRVVAEGLALDLRSTQLLVDHGGRCEVHDAQADAVLRADRDFVRAVGGEENRVRAPYTETLRSHRVAVAVAEATRTGGAADLRWHAHAH
ncbi:gfo/Idh/MocA family oxidoreductase [Actinoalloteichus sp. AHMU CJ021]|uniref:Dehydrogenase n=1 Tax=Actinoalloteichus caeruleus DSM 43889 TaxID=1120930 RepID=A0ABT1JD03_ACTCY|nr:Gfo/Idh/MocA family oxidoreductase [Actinoalloteichus caeruleus]AUS80926.1 gfo/Idh/MocA family oxidoreductase [Actinoalloteichus sp. AHMU CJ021]MCP2330368.1 putative dehydrogenase [Actinoalloteichus caeruleus DSM 43889]